MPKPKLFDDGEIRQERDGSWTLDAGFGTEPIFSIPTQSMAEHIRKQILMANETGYANAFCE